MTAPRKALFLDRDGTLIVDSHYLSDPAGVVVLPGVAEGLRLAREKGYLLFLFSNQSGVGRGYYTLGDALRVNARMLELLGLGEDLFTGVCMATEAPDQPMVYRKPSPRFIEESIAHHGLSKDASYMIGDRETDIEAGRNAGIRVAGLLNGKLNREGWARFEIPDLPLYENFLELAHALP